MCLLFSQSPLFCLTNNILIKRIRIRATVIDSLNLSSILSEKQVPVCLFFSSDSHRLLINRVILLDDKKSSVSMVCLCTLN